MILTSLLRVQVPNAPGQNADYVEIITRYQDGTELATSNVGIASPLAPLPWKIVQRFPGLDVVKLKERHDAAARDIAKELRRIPEREILEQWQETHRRRSCRRGSHAGPAGGAIEDPWTDNYSIPSPGGPEP